MNGFAFMNSMRKRCFSVFLFLVYTKERLRIVFERIMDSFTLENGIGWWCPVYTSDGIPPPGGRSLTDQDRHDRGL